MINCSGLGKNPCKRNKDSCMWLGKSKKCISIEELMQRRIEEKSAAHVALARKNAAITKAKRIAEWAAGGGGVGSIYLSIPVMERPVAPVTPPLKLKFPESSRPDLDPRSWWGQCSRCGTRTTHTHPLMNLYYCPQCTADPEWSTRILRTTYSPVEPPLPGGCGSINRTTSSSSLSSFNKRSRRRSTRRRSTRRRSTRRLRSRTARSRKSKSRVRRRRSRHKKY